MVVCSSKVMKGKTRLHTVSESQPVAARLALQATYSRPGAGGDEPHGFYR